MPELYGQPFKDELRAEISRLNLELTREYKERRLAQDRLVCARAKIREMEARTKAIELALQQITELVSRSVEINVTEELRKERQRKWDEIRKAADVAA